VKPEGAMSSQAYTPAVLACRKILMNVAVSVGAKAGESFASYVEFLAKEGYIPPNGKHWSITSGPSPNEANHEITLMSKDEAEKLITFVEFMLKFIYELPNVVPLPAPKPAMKPKKVKAWLVTWEWIGDHAKRPDKVAEILDPRLPAEQVRRIVELLYHREAFSQ